MAAKLSRNIRTKERLPDNGYTIVLLGQRWRATRHVHVSRIRDDSQVCAGVDSHEAHPADVSRENSGLMNTNDIPLGMKRDG